MSSALILSLWVQQRHVAEIGYMPLEDSWSLNYTTAWQTDVNAFPLSL